MPGNTATLQPPGTPPPREGAGTGQDAPCTPALTLQTPREAGREPRYLPAHGAAHRTGTSRTQGPLGAQNGSRGCARNSPAPGPRTAPLQTHAAPAPATPESTRDPPPHPGAHDSEGAQAGRPRQGQARPRSPARLRGFPAAGRSRRCRPTQPPMAGLSGGGGARHGAGPALRCARPLGPAPCSRAARL